MGGVNVGNYSPEMNPCWCTCSGLGAQLASGAAGVFKAHVVLHLKQARLKKYINTCLILKNTF